MVNYNIIMSCRLCRAKFVIGNREPKNNVCKKCGK